MVMVLLLTFNFILYLLLPLSFDLHFYTLFRSHFEKKYKLLPQCQGSVDQSKIGKDKAVIGASCFCFRETATI